MMRRFGGGGGKGGKEPARSLERREGKGNDVQGGPQHLFSEARDDKGEGHVLFGRTVQLVEQVLAQLPRSERCTCG